MSTYSIGGGAYFSICMKMPRISNFRVTIDQTFLQMRILTSIIKHRDSGRRLKLDRTNELLQVRRDAISAILGWKNRFINHQYLWGLGYVSKLAGKDPSVPYRSCSFDIYKLWCFYILFSRWHKPICVFHVWTILSRVSQLCFRSWQTALPGTLRPCVGDQGAEAGKSWPSSQRQAEMWRHLISNDI